MIISESVLKNIIREAVVNTLNSLEQPSFTKKDFYKAVKGIAKNYGAKIEVDFNGGEKQYDNIHHMNVYGRNLQKKDTVGNIYYEIKQLLKDNGFSDENCCEMYSNGNHSGVEIFVDEIFENE